MSFRDNGDKEKVQVATDIVRLIGEQVNLRPKGKEFVGLCPFHDDKTPSMQVSPQKQIYKCFSCGAGGDAFSFVMNYHKMGFVESLKYLAEKAGIELTPWRPDGTGGGGDDQGPTDRKRIAAANESAVSFFKALLKHETHGADARAYLERRGVSPEMVETFGLGYAPDRWDGLVTMVRERGWDRDGFEKAQLIRPRKTGDGDFDFLRHRLVFPIFDAIGRPIAFGGRKLRDEDEPKYLNSPETALFNKSATLYGLHAAKKPIIDDKTAVIVEGYTDVIACHQAGARNVVAALGTALTAEHVRELRRYCEQVVLVMDGDAAGQKAADRAIEVFLTGDLDVSIAVLPGGQDPDELMKARGLDAWEQVLASAREALAFAFDRVQANLNDAGTITGRQRVAEGFMNQLVELGLAQTGGVRRAFVVNRLAEMLHMSEAAVDRALKDRTPRSSRNPYQSGAESGGPADIVGPGSADNRENNAPDGLAIGQTRHRLQAVGKAERRLIAALVRHNNLFHATLPDGSSVDEAISPAELAHAEHRRLFERVYGALADGQAVELRGLCGDLAIDGEHALIKLATTADAELDRLLPEPPADSGSDLDDQTPSDYTPVKATLLDAAQTVIQHQQETHAQKLRQDLMRTAPDAPAGNPTPSDADRQAELLRRYVESRKANPSPGRIARL
ncbi:MAG: DNA primase [Planctomycetota bacterium]